MSRISRLAVVIAALCCIATSSDAFAWRQCYTGPPYYDPVEYNGDTCSTVPPGGAMCINVASGPLPDGGENGGEDGFCQEAGFTWGAFPQNDGDGSGTAYSRPGDCCWGCNGCTHTVPDPTYPGGSCQFNGQPVSHGASVTAYQAQTVQSPATCVSETRTCTNGSLSGSYQYAACTVGGFSLRPDDLVQ